MATQQVAIGGVIYNIADPVAGRVIAVQEILGLDVILKSAEGGFVSLALPGGTKLVQLMKAVIADNIAGVKWEEQKEAELWLAVSFFCSGLLIGRAAQIGSLATALSSLETSPSAIISTPQPS